MRLILERILGAGRAEPRQLVRGGCDLYEHRYENGGDGHRECDAQRHDKDHQAKEPSLARSRTTRLAPSQ